MNSALPHLGADAGDPGPAAGTGAPNLFSGRDALNGERTGMTDPVVSPAATGPTTPDPLIHHGPGCPGWPHCWAPTAELLDVIDEYAAASTKYPDLTDLLGEVITGIRAELAQREVRP